MSAHSTSHSCNKQTELRYSAAVNVHRDRIMVLITWRAELYGKKSS